MLRKGGFKMSVNYDEFFRKKFETFNELRKKMSKKEAWEKMLEGYPERQRKSMGQYIDNNTLYEGFTKAIPAYKAMGMDMKVVDISNKGIDGIIEIQHVCPYIEMAKEYEVKDPCHLLCDMDIEATRKAFPEMNARYIARQSKGDSVCAYLYQRPQHR
jgi:predicted ArsR family transcriptional regulator